MYRFAIESKRKTENTASRLHNSLNMVAKTFSSSSECNSASKIQSWDYFVTQVKWKSSLENRKSLFLIMNLHQKRITWSLAHGFTSHWIWLKTTFRDFFFFLSFSCLKILLIKHKFLRVKKVLKLEIFYKHLIDPQSLCCKVVKLCYCPSKIHIRAKS